MDHEKFPRGIDASFRYPNVQVTIERITPEVAEEMLKHNTHNRSFSKNNIKFKAKVRDMAEGRWVLNGCAIAFDENGVLVDGQNRLHACVMSGCSFDSIVIRGISMRAQASTDIGTDRTLGQLIAGAGVPDGKKLEPIVKVALATSMYGIEYALCSGFGCDMSMQERLDFALEHVDSMKRAQLMGARCRDVLPNGIVSPLVYLLTLIDQSDSDVFFGDLAKMVPSIQPVGMLRSRLMAERTREKSTGSRLSRKEISVFVIKAWNAFRAGEELKCLKYRSSFGPDGRPRERFPIPNGWTEEIRASITRGVSA